MIPLSHHGRVAILEGVHIALTYNTSCLEPGSSVEKWRIFCLVAMGVDIPTNTVDSILMGNEEVEKVEQGVSPEEVGGKFLKSIIY
jgi:hypothetical protein